MECVSHHWIDIPGEHVSAGYPKLCVAEIWTIIQIPHTLHWNLQIKDTLGTTVLFLIERLSSFRSKKILYLHYGDINFWGLEHVLCKELGKEVVLYLKCLIGGSNSYTTVPLNIPCDGS